MDPQTPSDEALVEQYRRVPASERGGIADELFARHYERVARWCYRFTGDRESAADLAQDVFLKAHRHLDKFRGSSRFTTWLYAIARNESLNRLAKRTAPAPQDPEEALADAPSPDPSPEQIAAAGSRERWVHQFLEATLDETERVVFTLHCGDDMTLESVTRLLGLKNPSGAKAYIVSARRKLARAVQRLRERGEEL